MPTSFGQVIQPTGPGIGFPGTVSRQGERVITARELVQQTSSGTYNLNFGDPAVLIPNATGGFWASVLDFVTAATSNIGLLAAQFAGMAVREVMTSLSYPATVTPGTLQVGYYNPTSIAEVMERGSGTVLLTLGSPSAGSQVYTRVVANAATSTAIGDWEAGTPAASDLFTLNGITAAAAAATSLTGITFTGVYVGQVVSGPGIAPGTYVVSGTGTAGSYTTIVLSNGLTTAITATSVLTFSNLVALPNVVARTGFVDANNMLEITIKVRNAA
jgi:hypothetical protein